MASTASRLLTAEEFIALPDDGRRYELVQGRLVDVGGSAQTASIIAAALVAHLFMYVATRGLGRVGGADFAARLFDDPDTVRVPDAVFVRLDRMRGGDALRGFYEGAPDLVVEVLSPSDRYGKTRDKVAEYLAAGVKLIWILDPEDHSVAIHRVDGSTSTLDETGALDGEEIIPGFRLELAPIWGLLDIELS